ncbi:Na+/H+ antiporter [Sphingobacterium sp. SRCM116780]|uniref:Na+/H+ antiporter n=1 Tax=Sphingobacterium sp. SRCM116780 TaxID=2907623 RepID=UPI001F1704FA|nr:Na+/H+ antiporter [Sphingobacterium sp. SRCM116780]UIR54665.1 Na+/H+ antiporter [Sphingobacterium sp. SRCM116780]
MLENFPFYLSLIVLIIFLIMIGNKIKVAYPVLLVLAGLGISLIPGIPMLKINPELIFIIFLPPLLYEAAWATSWKELWHWRRIIGSFAFVVVFLTAVSVAFVANHFIPGFSLALGFLLGGIVSPPDAVSANAILKFVKVPKRLSSILEGESLLNDASSLIIFRFALIAVATRQFIWHDALLSFGWMVIGGVGIGLLIGYVFMKIHKRLPTDVNMDIALTLVAPYVMYIAAEEVHSSGVLAVVSAGLFLSNQRHKFLKGTSRLRSENVWQSFVFLLNGLVFMLIGLDMPEITSGLRAEGINIYQATGFGLLITLVLVVGRILACYGAVLVTLVMRNFITVADAKNPGLRTPIFLGWAGMRGVVSLAAALSIPVHMDNGMAFPHRNMILYITFVVILVTLLVQGLTLPILIKKAPLPEFPDHLTEAETEEMLENALSRELSNFLGETKDPNNLNHQIKDLVSILNEHHHSTRAIESNEQIKTIWLTLLERQRILLLEMNKKHPNIDEEIIRKYLHKIDLDEEKLNC